MTCDIITIPSLYFKWPTSDSTIISSLSRTKQPSLNFSYGAASLCLDTIITSEDLQKARERIKKEKEDGKSVTQKLKESAKITAGIVWKCGTNHLGKSVIDAMKQDQTNKFIAEKQKIQKKEKAHLKLKSNSDTLIVTRKKY